MQAPKSLESQRNQNLDLLRVLSMLAVIVVHAAAPFIARSGGHNSQFTVAVLYDSFARFCVPMFVMISGALMFSVNSNIDKSPGRYYWKKAVRFLPALTFWLLFYWWFSGKLGMVAEGNVFQILGNAWHLLITDVPHYHLWYIYMLPGLFLVAPLLRWMKRKLRPSQWLFLGVGLLVFGMLHNGWRIYMAYSLPRYYEFVDFLGYLILGDVLLKVKFSKRLAISGFVVGSLILAAIIYFYTLRYPGQFFFDSFLSPFIVLPTLSLFVWGNQRISLAKNRVVANLAIASFGIYLIHAAIIDVLMQKTGFSLTPFPSFDIFVYTVVTLALSYGAVWLLRKSTLTKWMV